jgi:PST family polysaccharide transporter
MRLGLQLAMLPILARLVGPAEYGLVALAIPFILFANVLADGGMSYALGRRQVVSRELESTVFWLSGGIGATLALCCCLIAWPMGAMLAQPRLPALIMALSPILFMNGLAAVSNARIIREGRFSVFAGGDLIATGAAAAVAVAAATHGLGAWSLVAQQLTLWVCKLGWVSLAGRASVGLHFRFAEARELLTFGMHTIGAMLADFVSRNIDNLIVGGVLGATALGYYAMAYQIVRVPDMLISGPCYLYIMTAFARAAHDGKPQAVQALAASALRLGSAALAPLFVGLALTADVTVPLVLGEKWLEAIAPLRWLAGAGFFFCMCSIMAMSLMGLGRGAQQFRLSLILGGATIAAVGVGAAFGVTAASALLATAIAAVCGLYVWRLAGGLKMPRRTLAIAFAPAAAAAIPMAGVLVVVKPALAALPAYAALAVMVGLGAAVYGAAILLIGGRRLLGDLRAFARAQSEASDAVAS